MRLVLPWLILCAACGSSVSTQKLTCSGAIACATGSGTYSACTTANGSECAYQTSDGKTFSCNSCGDCVAAAQMAVAWCTGSMMMMMTNNTAPEQHNLDMLNSYRAQNGAPALTISTALDTFATTGSQDLAAGGDAHAHFKAAGADGSLWTSGFCSGAGENQAPDWPVNGTQNSDENGTIDAILASMMAEGPGGGHHDNIVNPKFATLGVGLVVYKGGLFLTNDFSDACP